MEQDRPTILIIAGITGDLAQRKLLPALEKLAENRVLPNKFFILGLSRRTITIKDITAPHLLSSYIHNHIGVLQADISDENDLQKIHTRIQEIETGFGTQAQKLFYLSVPPHTTATILRNIGASLFGNDPTVKILLEKPFGTDYPSAQELMQIALTYFTEEQLYLIDHYLAKEMAQNVIVFRRKNSLFRQIWNNQFIESIDIIASESLDIEGRAQFYEQTGALRDLVQSHLLQLAALTLMDIPDHCEDCELKKYRLQALEKLKLNDPPLRGQYEGYRKEVENSSSMTETFVLLSLESVDPHWGGVPIRLLTGKALDKKVTEIRVNFKEVGTSEANTLMFRIQPHEGVAIGLWEKKPGYDTQIARVALSFTYENYYTWLPEAYERVILDAISSDNNLFTSPQEVLASWKLLTPLLEQWQTDKSLIFYKKGSSLEEVMDIAHAVPHQLRSVR